VRQRSKAGGEPVKARRRKAATPKLRTAPKSISDRRLSAAGLQELLHHRTRELNEALRQQTATCGGVAGNQAGSIRFAKRARYSCAVGRAAVRSEDGEHLAAERRCLPCFCQQPIQGVSKTQGISEDCFHRTQPKNGHRQGPARWQDRSRARHSSIRL
jgi:hypothetical protein